MANIQELSIDETISKLSKMVAPGNAPEQPIVSNFEAEILGVAVVFGRDKLSVIGGQMLDHILRKIEKEVDIGIFGKSNSLLVD